MTTSRREKQIIWLAMALLAGFVVPNYWPHEHAHAETLDRSSKIAMLTVNTQAGESDAVFVLDFVTGRLVGTAYNAQSGGFNQTYYANLAEDFQVGENAQYAIVTGWASIPRAGGGPQPANGCIYVAELNSGKVVMYGIPFVNARGNQPTRPLMRLGWFPFRETHE